LCYEGLSLPPYPSRETSQTLLRFPPQEVNLMKAEAGAVAMPGGEVQIKLGKKGKPVYNNPYLTLQEGFTKSRSIVERDRGGIPGGRDSTGSDSGRYNFSERRGIMGKKFYGKWLGLILSILVLASASISQAEKKVDLVGRETLNFTLPSTQDRVINYAEEYYGKHHLIITFFPAAYTPI
jgi:hypothetical protein